MWPMLLRDNAMVRCLSQRPDLIRRKSIGRPVDEAHECSIRYSGMMYRETPVDGSSQNRHEIVNFRTLRLNALKAM